MSNPSFYFTLFKKFQILGHLAENSLHGTPGGFAGFDLTDPNSVFTALGGTLLGPSPANSPLWGMLNAAANGQSSVVVGGTIYPAMPTDTTTAAWQDFQVNPAPPKLLDAFADWINAGNVNDIPSGVIGAEPGAIGAPPDSGVSPFVCSFAGDAGDPRPDGVPGDYWDTSLIFLVDPSNGNIVTPATLTGGSEFYLVAVVGNRGQSAGGKYSSGGATVQAKGIAMVWNTTFSPGVELPSLSNLDAINDDSSLYEQYFLDKGQYDVVGFRLNVQTVFDGIVAAVAASGMDLGGKSPADWVKDPAQGAHLCAKVVVRQGTDSFPNVGDTPLTTNKIAQKNLAPFDASLAVVSPDPNIIWKNFVVGQPFFIKLGQGEGRNTLILEENLPREAFTLYIAITTRTFERYFREGGGGGFKGFKVVPHHELCGGKLGDLAKPFPQAVILRYLGGANGIELPALGGEEFLGMSLGIEYSVRRLKPGEIGKVKVVHRAVIPCQVPGTLCFELKEVTVGGFTIVVRATDPRRRPKVN